VVNKDGDRAVLAVYLTMGKASTCDGKTR